MLSQASQVDGPMHSLLLCHKHVPGKSQHKLSNSLVVPALPNNGQTWALSKTAIGLAPIMSAQELAWSTFPGQNHQCNSALQMQHRATIRNCNYVQLQSGRACPEHGKTTPSLSSHVLLFLSRRQQPKRLSCGKSCHHTSKGSRRVQSTRN